MFQIESALMPITFWQVFIYFFIKQPDDILVSKWPKFFRTWRNYKIVLGTWVLVKGWKFRGDIPCSVSISMRKPIFWSTKITPFLTKLRKIVSILLVRQVLAYFLKMQLLKMGRKQYTHPESIKNSSKLRYTNQSFLNKK